MRGGGANFELCNPGGNVMLDNNVDTSGLTQPSHGTARSEWLERRKRLRNPPNAVKDRGIDLRRKPITISSVERTESVPIRRSTNWINDLIEQNERIGEPKAQPNDAAPIGLHEYNEHLRRICRTGLPREPVYVPPRIEVRTIIKAVAHHYGVSLADMISARRTAHVVRPRQVAMYLAKKFTLRSLPDLGRRFGDRDHTTILSGIRKMERVRKVDAELDRTLCMFEAALSAASAD